MSSPQVGNDAKVRAQAAFSIGEAAKGDDGSVIARLPIGRESIRTKMEHTGEAMVRSTIASIIAPALPLAPGGPALRRGRAHEACGPARRAFAAMTAGALGGPVIWISGGAPDGALNPEGLWPLMEPGRLICVAAPRAREALWAAEEALRSAAAPLVVLEPAAPPALTPVRRLQLAAEATVAGDRGRATAPPLCLILTPDGGSAPAVETRWRVDPLPAAPNGAPRWRLALTRDKGGPPGVWRAQGAAPEASAQPRRGAPPVRLRADAA
jgi:protein ImuA